MTTTEQPQKVERLVVCPICQTEMKRHSIHYHIDKHRRAGELPEGFAFEMPPLPDPEPCPICGATENMMGGKMDGHGMAVHIARHTLGPPKQLIKNPKNGKRSKAKAKTMSTELVPVSSRRNGHTQPTPLDIALAVLGKVSPDGRVAVADLPEVLTWVAQTHQIIERVSIRQRR